VAPTCGPRDLHTRGYWSATAALTPALAARSSLNATVSHTNELVPLGSDGHDDLSPFHAQELDTHGLPYRLATLGDAAFFGGRQIDHGRGVAGMTILSLNAPSFHSGVGG
jgi:hypothetical protein